MKKKQIIAFSGLAAAGLTTAIALAEGAASSQSVAQSVNLTYGAIAFGCTAMVYGIGKVMQLKLA